MVAITLYHDGLAQKSIEIDDEDATVEALADAVVSLTLSVSLCIGDIIKIQEV